MTRIGIIGSPRVSGISTTRLAEHWELVEAVSARPGRLDLLVIYEASPLKVARALEMWPRAAILAVLPMHGYEGDALAVLEAGAESCVRTPHAHVVVGQLETLERRRDSLLAAAGG